MEIYVFLISFKGLELVVPLRHLFEDFGDEGLELSSVAEVWVAPVELLVVDSFAVTPDLFCDKITVRALKTILTLAIYGRCLRWLEEGSEVLLYESDRLTTAMRRVIVH